MAISVKNFIRKFPFLSKETIESGKFTDDEVIKIFETIDPHLNTSNDEIRQKLLAVGNDIRRVVDYISYKRTVTGSHKSKRQIEFWLVRGHSTEDAKSIVSNIQSMNSPRSILYWTSRGYDDITAKQMVSDTQHKNARKLHEAARRNGTPILTPSNKQFWLNKGLSEKDAILKIKEISTKGGRAAKETFNRANCIWCREYYNTDEEYEFAMSKMYSFTSKQANSFFDIFAGLYNSEKSYYGSSEFGKYIPDVGYVKYDYVDTQFKFVIEFDGVYWHSSEEAKTRDKIKEDFITNLGYSVYRVTDKEFNENPDLPKLLWSKIKCDLLNRHQLDDTRFMKLP